MQDARFSLLLLLGAFACASALVGGVAGAERPWGASALASGRPGGGVARAKRPWVPAARAAAPEGAAGEEGGAPDDGLQQKDQAENTAVPAVVTQVGDGFAMGGSGSTCILNN
ncbi:hypothetical protein T492DRAFT_848808 [Pavlovales sp. CCMP2436]|nr:hypothetical protein T492DRAFT_848808 [Pavlovales sp. CCMP2436]